MLKEQEQEHGSYSDLRERDWGHAAGTEDYGMVKESAKALVESFDLSDSRSWKQND